MSPLIKKIKELIWFDLATGSTRHWTKGKLIGFKHAESNRGPGKTALDLGCGDGFWSQRLAGLGYQVTSVDHDKYYDQTQIVNLEEKLPFPDNSFDLVWSTEVIEHLFTPEQFIAEIERVLKPGGLMVVTTPNSHFWLYPLLRIFGYRPVDVQNPDHKQFFHIRDLVRLVPEAKIYGFFPYWLVKMTLVNQALISLLSPTFTVVKKLT